MISFIKRRCWIIERPVASINYGRNGSQFQVQAYVPPEPHSYMVVRKIAGYRCLSTMDGELIQLYELATLNQPGPANTCHLYRLPELRQIHHVPVKIGRGIRNAYARLWSYYG